MLTITTSALFLPRIARPLRPHQAPVARTKGAKEQGGGPARRRMEEGGKRRVQKRSNKRMARWANRQTDERIRMQANGPCKAFRPQIKRLAHVEAKTPGRRRDSAANERRRARRRAPTRAQKRARNRCRPHGAMPARAMGHSLTLRDARPHGGEKAILPEWPRGHQ